MKIFAKRSDKARVANDEITTAARKDPPPRQSSKRDVYIDATPDGPKIRDRPPDYGKDQPKRSGVTGMVNRINCASCKRETKEEKRRLEALALEAQVWKGRLKQHSIETNPHVSQDRPVLITVNDGFRDGKKPIQKHEDEAKLYYSSSQVGHSKTTEEQSREVAAQTKIFLGTPRELPKMKNLEDAQKNRRWLPPKPSSMLSKAKQEWLRNYHMHKEIPSLMHDDDDEASQSVMTGFGTSYTDYTDYTYGTDGTGTEYTDDYTNDDYTDYTYGTDWTDGTGTEYTNDDDSKLQRHYKRAISRHRRRDLKKSELNLLEGSLLSGVADDLAVVARVLIHDGQACFSCLPRSTYQSKLRK